jgi:hypothetical protein
MNILGNAIFKFIFYQRPFLKGWWIPIKFFVGPWLFNCEKSITIAVCGKCLVQMFNFTSMSSIQVVFPFVK